MSITYKCNLCDKTFKQKGNFTKHQKRTSACVSLNKLKILSIPNSKLNIVTSLNKCLNILRDNANVLGEDALHIISYFLILALMEPKLGSDHMDMYNESFYNFEVFDPDDKTKLFHVLKFSNLIKESKDDYSFYLRNLWQNILSVHPKTKDIYKENNIFGINSDKDDVLTDILKTLSEINFENIDTDILGDCYEDVVKNTLLQGDGQFFTPPHIKDIAVKLVNPGLNDDGTIDSIFDPAMGTGGFILTCIKYIKESAKSKNIQLNWNQISENLGGREVIEKTFQFAKANCLVYSGHVFSAIEMNDSIRIPIIKKYNCVVANPPYGIKGLTYDKIKHVIRDEYLPIVTNSAVPLFIQAIIYMLEINGRCAIVIPNGQELSAKSNDLINIRMFLLKSCDLSEVIYFNEKSFKKTGIKVCILYFIKKLQGSEVVEIIQKINKKEIEDTNNRTYKFIDNYQTSNIKFYEYDKKNEKKLLINVDIDKISKNNYSLNYKDYLIEDEQIYGNNIVIKTFTECCTFLPKSKRLASYGKENGLYPFYTSSNILNKYCDEPDYKQECLILGTGGNPNVKINTNFSCSSHNFIVTSKSLSNNKYLYYWFSSNMHILEHLFHGATIKNLSKCDLDKIKIPIPSLEMQNSAIEYLDFIYECNKTSNDKINELRKLNNYTIQMQKIIGRNQIKTFTECCTFLPKSKRLASYGKENGLYPFYTSSNILNKYCDEPDYKQECLILGTGGNPNVKINTNFSCSSHNFIVTSKSLSNNKYLYYWFSSNMHILEHLFHGATIKNLSKYDLDKIKIPIPSLEIQQEIIEYCESNENLIKQLEKEIEINKSKVNIFMNNIEMMDNNQYNNIQDDNIQDEIILSDEIKLIESDEDLIENIIENKVDEDIIKNQNQN